MGHQEPEPEPTADATQVMKAIGPNDLVFDSPLSPVDGTQGFRLQQGQQQQGQQQQGQQDRGQSQDQGEARQGTSTREEPSC
jgi:hypothetical protein